MEPVLVSVPKKSRRGNIFNSVRCNYLRSDISCSHTFCTQCISSHTPLCTQELFIFTQRSTVLHLSFLENQSFFTPANTIFVQSTLIGLKKSDIKQYERLKIFIEDKKFAVFFNEHCKDTYIDNSDPEKSVKTPELIKSYYNKHLPGLSVEVVSENIYDILKHSPLIDYLPVRVPAGPELYPEYLPYQQFFALVKSGDLFEGVFHVLRDDQSKAWVSINKGVKQEMQVSVIGLNANRAIDGDIVAVELLSGMDTDGKIEEDEGVDVIVTGKNVKKALPSLQGRVVGVFKRKAKNYCGSIQRTGENLGCKEICVFSPINPKIPQILMYLEHPHLLENQRVSVEIDCWDIFSQYPKGHLVRVIGDISRLETESEVILLEHDVIIKPFTQAALDCLPANDWKIPESEFLCRQDLRNRIVASVDPPGCKDIDDALHCSILPNGNYEVGVHIADVTYFVKANSALDIEASERCTTVYLVEKRTDMLPGVLTEVLCSLVCNRDRLAFSVLWEITPEGKVIKTYYTKSIIHSRASLSYQAASQMINSDNNDELSQSLRRLLKISQILKANRVLNGALELASTEVKFELDPEKQGKDIALYKTFETNSMVEEFMLLANVAVGNKIVNTFPAYSILRRHPPPKFTELATLSEKLQKIGINLQYESSKELAKCLNNIKSKDPYVNTLVKMQVTRCMNQAVYFCSSEFDRLEFRHYGLAAEIYTHFTSPIRRYADVLVHRLLSASIDVESLPDSMTDRRIMGKMCRRMNFRNRMSQFAERTSANLHTYLVFKSKGICIEEAIVTDVCEYGVNVIVPKIGLEGSIELKGKMGDDGISWVGEQGVLRVYGHLKIRISISFVNFRKTISLELLEVIN